MDVFEAIKKRYSCRSYEARPVEKEKLDRVLEAARLAPSALTAGALQGPARALGGAARSDPISRCFERPIPLSMEDSARVSAAASGRSPERASVP